MTDLVARYLAQGWRLVFWDHVDGDKGPKGPHNKNWTTRTYGLGDYRAGSDVGVFLGHEVSPGRFLHDVDVDWGPGVALVRRLLPNTGFAFGRSSKRLSHLLYTASRPLMSVKFVDPVDGVTLIELRGTRSDGEVGLQTMIPPSVWSKPDGTREPLEIIREGSPGHLEDADRLPRLVTYVAVGCLLARHLGHNGFGHEPRLAFAGTLLRLGVEVGDVTAIGEGVSELCNNTEVGDVKTVVDTTARRLAAGDTKTRGGPALAKILGDHGRKIITEISRWLGRTDDYVRDDDGKIVANHQHNVRLALSNLEWRFFRDAFADKLLAQNGSGGPTPLSDDITEALWLRVDAELHFRPSFDFFERVVRVSARESETHPVLTYLDALEWDGNPRLDRWLVTYGGADDSEYVRAVGALTLIAAVRRVRAPGCKFDELLILESAQQGIGKSSALRLLCPNEEWFSDDLPLNVDAKQMIERTAGKWIIEAAELSKMRDTQTEQLKATLSRQVDGPARLAYARMAVERRRHFVIIGTTNASVYLNDATGNRRFWPVKTPRFDLTGLREERDQLWAEAAHREARGESIRLSERLWKPAEDQQSKRRLEDAWHDVLENVVAPIADDTPIPVSVLYDAVGLSTDRRDVIAAKRITMIMQELGFERKTFRNEVGRVMKGWYRPGDGDLLTKEE